MIKSCEQCKNNFSALRSKQKFCSPECHQSSRKRVNPIFRSCVNKDCQKKFEVSQLSDPKKYCSSTCAAHVNNQITPKRALEGNCGVCNIAIKSKNKYCQNHTPIYGKDGKLVFAEAVTRLCKEESCSKSFLTHLHYKTFCSKECQNTFFSKRQQRDPNRAKQCPSCSRKKSAHAEYCADCSKNNKLDKRIQEWKNGNWSGGTSNKLSTTVRRHLLEEANYTCTSEGCGFNTPHPVDGSTVLEIDHVDGDGSNHRPENLKVLCPNCHVLTPTYRGRNAGNGRKVYYLRITK